MGISVRTIMVFLSTGALMPMRNKAVLSLVAAVSTMVQTMAVADDASMPACAPIKTAYLALYKELWRPILRCQQAAVPSCPSTSLPT